MRFCCYLQYFSKVGPLRKASFWGPFLVPFWDPKWLKRGPKWHLKNSSKIGRFLVHFGVHFGTLWGPLGRKIGVIFWHLVQMGPQGAQRAILGPILEPFWSHFGAILVPFLINFRCHMEQCGGLRAEYFRRDIGLFFLV